MKKVALVLSILSLVTGARASQDLPAEIRRQLSTSIDGSVLYYPASTKQFYKQTKFQPAWIKPQGGTGPAWQAMLLLDCVMQYGLAHDDYHPKDLLYNHLHAILDTPGKVSIPEQARFEIILTDAIITLMNHLHYGKLNPEFTAERVDTSNSGFRAEASLAKALQLTRGYDFLAAIDDVQPKSKAYQQLQRHMRLLTGLYTGDCYEVPEGNLRTIAVNMERLRWTNIDGDSYIQINIPSYTLKFIQPDTVYQFRVAVGKAANPTPAFNSAVSFFITAPDMVMLQDIFVDIILPNTLKNPDYLVQNHLAIYNKKGEFIPVDKLNLTEIEKHPGTYFARHASGCDRGLGSLVFHFANPFDIDLHDMPRKDFLNRPDRALSSGCIWLDNAEKLAALLLKTDGRENEVASLHKAVARYQRETFILHKQVPLIVTYLTCEIDAGELFIYKDVYNLDKSLEMALYNVKPNPVMP